MQFIDAVICVSGANSLFHAVLQQLHLPGYWQRPTNDWIQHRYPQRRVGLLPEARLLLVEPTLVSPSSWQAQLMALIPERCRSSVSLRLPAVWSYGGLAAVSKQRGSQTACCGIQRKAGRNQGTVGSNESGLHVPGLKCRVPTPKNYDENGTPIKLKTERSR